MEGRAGRFAVPGQHAGERPKKLVGGAGPDGNPVKGWAHYEFGTSIGDAPGNCRRCADYHRSTILLEHRANVERAARSGIELPVRPPTNPPCRQCPKWELFPTNYGLDPRNELAVEVFGAAYEEIRVGTFAGAPLISMLTPSGVHATLDEFEGAQRFVSPLHRYETFLKVMALGRVAKEIIGGREEAHRQANQPPPSAH